MIELNHAHTDEPLASFVKRLGSPVSTILLHSPCSTFSIPQVDGVIGYQEVGKRAVVIGDPICSPQDIPELIQAFHHHCQTHHLTVVYLLTSDSFAHWAINNGCHTLIQAGEELVMDPTAFQVRQKLRWKINQSLHHGVVIKEYKNFDLSFENQMNSTIDTWLKARHGPQIHLGRLNFSADGVEKRVFYALQNEKIVGLLELLPVDCFQGWVVSYFLSVFEAPKGTTEHLMSSVFNTLASEACHFLCLGAVSGSKLGEVIGLNRFTKFFAHLLFKMSKFFFHLDARKIYFNKYHPYSRPSYTLFSGKLTLAELFAIKKTLNVKL